MYLDPSALLDMLPGLLKVFLHLCPHLQLVSLQVSELLSGFALQLVEAVPSLDDGGLLHQELKLSEVAAGAVTFPALLDEDGGHAVPVWTFEHCCWTFYHV